MTYQEQREQIKTLFETSPFTMDLLQKNEPATLKEKVAHIYNVANLTEESAKKNGAKRKTDAYGLHSWPVPRHYLRHGYRPNW